MITVYTFHFSWWMNSWPLLKAVDDLALTSSDLTFLIWNQFYLFKLKFNLTFRFHTNLNLLYFWHPRYNSFPAFPSPLGLVHPSCSMAAENFEALILMQAALCSSMLQRGMSLLYLRSESSPHIGENRRSPLCILVQQINFFKNWSFKSDNSE